MNSYQRVMNTLSGRPADRVPVFAVLGAYGANLTGVDLHTLFSDASAYVSGQIALQREFGFDLVMSAFDYSIIAEAFGGKVAWFQNQVPNVKRPAVSKAADALTLPLPDLLSTARLPMTLEISRRLADLYKEKVPIVSVIPGPCILPSLIVGIEAWMEAVLFEPELAQQLQDYCAPFLVSWANALVDAGTDCLVFTEGMVASEIGPRSMFVEQFLPHLRAVFAQIKGPKILHHNGGSINHVLDLLPGLNGVVGFTIGSKDSPTEARRILGPEMNLVGNLDNLTIATLTAKEAYEMSLALLRTAAPAGHYILCNSAADIPQATPSENLRAMLSASENYSTEIR